MYEKYFNLNEKPFSLSPDPKYLYMSKRHGQALALLEYGVQEQVGFAVITGEIGSGKTSLIRKLLDQLGDSDNIGLVSHTHRDLNSIIPTVLDSFGVMVDEIPEGEMAQYRLFVEFLVHQFSKGRKSILIIDEAQNLSIEALEQLRLLSNVNSDGNLLLQTILVGQPELKDKLTRPELQQFAQRISVDFFLASLSLEEAKQYIDYRIKTAGGHASIISEDAKNLIADVTNGIPRLINNLCDLALVYTFGEGKTAVDMEMAMSVVKDKIASGIIPLKSSTLLISTTEEQLRKTA